MMTNCHFQISVRFSCPWGLALICELFVFLLRQDMRLCKTQPPCNSHSVEQIVPQWFEKVCGQSQDTQLGGSLNKVWNVIFFSQEPNFLFFCLSRFGFINFDPRSEFTLVFKIFVNMFWRAGCLGCTWVLLEFGSWSNFCLILSLEWQKTNQGGQKQKLIYFVMCILFPDNILIM